MPIIYSTGTIHVLHVHAYYQVVFFDSDFSEGGREGGGGFKGRCAFYDNDSLAGSWINTQPLLL